MATDGAPPKNMYASDISGELWQLGFDLFNDREKMVANFVEADIFDTDSGLEKLSGRIDIIIANQFLHLFDWEGQIAAMKAIVKLSKPGSIVIGYQRAQVPAQEIRRPWGTMYLHDLDTFQKIWQRVELETGSKWDVETDLVDLREWGMEPEDFSWMPDGKRGIDFVGTRRA